MKLKFEKINEEFCDRRRERRKETLKT